MNPALITLLVIALILFWVAYRCTRGFFRRVSPEPIVRGTLAVVSTDPLGRRLILEAADNIRKTEDAGLARRLDTIEATVEVIARKTATLPG
jgi:hypothetical protein